MNSRSVLRVSYNVRASLTFHMSCLLVVLLLLLCIYCFSPPFYCPVVSTSAADAPVIDYFVDDRTPTVELAGKQSHSLPQISPTFSVLSCTRHCYCCCYDYNPIQLHSLILSPLDVPFLYPMLPIIIYALFSSEPCALLARVR